jgi:hypothetical protein
MSWGGNTGIAAGSGLTDSAGTTYTFATSTLVVTAFTSTPTTPTNTFTDTSGTSVVTGVLNALN